MIVKIMVDILAISDDGHNDDDVIPARLAPVDCRLLRGEKSPKLPEKIWNKKSANLSL